MKTERFDMSKLHNEEHFEFMTELRNLIQSVTPAVVNLTPLFPVFLELYNLLFAQTSRDCCTTQEIATEVRASLYGGHHTERWGLSKRNNPCSFF